MNIASLKFSGAHEKVKGHRQAGAISMARSQAVSMPPLTLLDNIPWMQRRTMLPSGLRVWRLRNGPEMP